LSTTNIRNDAFRKFLLLCGICSSLLYLITDILAGSLYKGYSFNEQAVSELFAIGAPTSRVVVPLFTLCSILLLAFAIGVWLSSDNKRILHILAIMIGANAINSLILWNFFPMHMRGVQQTFTDIMHLIFAINPFVLISIVLGSVIFRNWFRFYSIGTILLLFIPAFMSFSYTPLLVANQPTPWLGFTERISQYSHLLWHLVLAILLLQGSVVASVSSGVNNIKSEL
jgi:hypothetical protein